MATESGHGGSPAPTTTVPVVSATADTTAISASEWPGRMPTAAVPAYRPSGVPGAPATPGTGSKTGWTGIPGVVAFGVSIVCVQAWAAIGYGIMIAFIGNAFGDFFSTSSSSGYCDYWESDCQSAQSTANTVVIVGIVLAALGLLLLISVIALMRGNRGCQVFCCLTQVLLIVLSVIAGANADEPSVAAVGAIFPLVALICLASGPANRLVESATIAARTGARH